MPTYNYSCTACGHNFEAVQKITASPLIDCPECQQQTLKKIISATGIVFKGGGWNRFGSHASSHHDDSPPPPTCGAGACPSCALD